MRTLIVKVLIFTIVVPGSVTVWIPRLLLPDATTLPEHIVRLAGLLPIALGAAIYLWCAWEFATRGRGTPAPIDPPKKLVISGLYRYVRNPMYVGVMSVLLGESLFFDSTVLLRYAGLVWLVFHLWIVFYEERALRDQFGGAYEEYCARVPRWIPALASSRS